MKLLLTKHKQYARIVFMFPDKYKHHSHHSRQPKSLIARVASKLVALLKRDNQVADTTNAWVI